MKFCSSCFIILLFGLATVGNAQLVDNYSLNFSIHESLAFSTDRTTVREPLLGWEIGFSVEKEILDRFSLSSGAHLTRVRFGLEDVGASHVTYLTVPVDLKLMFPWKIFAKAGPKIMFKVASRDAKEPTNINGFPGYIGDGFASAADFFVPGWNIGIGKEFSLFGFDPWIEICYGEDFKSFSGYDGLIKMNKRMRKVSIGIPLSN